jgi:hypothetical protein
MRPTLLDNVSVTTRRRAPYACRDGTEGRCAWDAPCNTTAGDGGTGTGEGRSS